jgi:hypothetical protein
MTPIMAQDLLFGVVPITTQGGLFGMATGLALLLLTPAGSSPEEVFIKRAMMFFIAILVMLAVSQK